VTQAVVSGKKYEVVVLHERRTAGTFPAGVEIRLNGPVTVSGPRARTGSGSSNIGPGTYKNGDTTCVVTNITLGNGRVQSFFNCTYNTTIPSELSVATGGISAGHPFQAELVDAGINARPDAATYTWGLGTNYFTRVGSCAISEGSPVGVKTNGRLLILSEFSPRSGEFICSGTLTRQ
jgi:hypothetical protein